MPTAEITTPEDVWLEGQAPVFLKGDKNRSKRVRWLLNLVQTHGIPGNGRPEKQRVEWPAITAESPDPALP